MKRKARFKNSGLKVKNTIPIYKGKGDVLMVDKHRGVRLLEQDMKVYEKTREEA